MVEYTLVAVRDRTEPSIGYVYIHYIVKLFSAVLGSFVSLSYTHTRMHNAQSQLDNVWNASTGLILNRTGQTIVGIKVEPPSNWHYMMISHVTDIAECISHHIL